jgi:hypothetical protein
VVRKRLGLTRLPRAVDGLFLADAVAESRVASRALYGMPYCVGHATEERRRVTRV